ncbi:DMT family transporter [Desulfosporosinus shakirovi]|uniref:DMT family transporter n=1 Tax=Desulfosporosinus shakirovi TaxID=2885154 RepID=UPI001E32ADA0|nr:DMT family transporter [Desulfosporosinus sp. SRJS8]MCB8818243.1 DMT family transporter [Desulfosporosinus sp. SRJS8]
MNRFKLVLVMIIWGSLGVFTRSIPLSALSLAFLRALIALPVLFVVMKMKKGDQVKWTLLKPYLISGVLLGFGWLTLFYGFKHTSISSAVMIYNMCPVYVMIAAPLLLKETISKIQIAVIFISFLGLCLIIGHNLLEGHGYLGLALSAVSGMLYAAIVLINRSIKVRVDNQTATFVQIFAAMIVLLPFVLIDGTILRVVDLDARAVTYTILLGILHTSVAYTMFFSLYTHMKSVEIVSYSYLEPLFGIIFSVIFVGETLTLPQIMGGILILGSTYLGEMLKDGRLFNLRSQRVLPPR